MGLLDIFRRRRIRDLAALTEFLESRSAFLVQKCIWEYSRARSGVVWRELFQEEEFKTAIERSIWSNLPLSLLYVAEMAEGILRPHADDPVALMNGVVAVAVDVTNRHLPPPAVPSDLWEEARPELVTRLRQSGLAEPKSVRDIPLVTIETFFERLPMHPRMRMHDFELIQNNIRSNLIRIHEDFLRDADRPALAAALVAVGRARAA